CGRTRLLRRCLNALLRQSLPVDRYEIIVVDDGPAEATRHVVEMFGAQPGAPRIRYVVPAAGKRGPAAARNAGWQAAAAPLIAFTDDDTIPARDWLVTGLAGLHEWAAAAAGRVKVPLPEQPSDWQLSSAGLDGAEFVTANCFVRRAALVTVGGFDESFRRPWREDSDLYFSLLNKGYRVVSVPTSVVVHPVRSAPWGVSLRVQRNMFFDALLYKKHPHLYRAKISQAPPVLYYAVVGALAIALGSAATGHAGITLLASGAWLGWTLWFAAQRLRGTRRDMSHVIEMLVTSAAIPPLAVFWRVAGAFRFRVLFA
ncbi:MAG TPA: glycosyltransferase family A protein, partial [Burkholderiales bacterium]|nr:glycosyltransferase family A protein [Burkholderiales bacterium]